MSQPITHTALNTPTWIRTRRLLHRAWVAVALGAVCGVASVSAYAKPMSESAIQSRTIRSDDAGVVLQTRSGDSLRTIAQYYSVKNNIPFKQALSVLTQANQAQFPGGDPDRMQVGAQIVLPPHGQTLKQAEPAASANTSTAAATDTVAAATPAAQTTPVPATAPAAATAPTTQPEAPASAASSTQTTPSVQGDVVAQSKSWFSRVPKSLWWVILPALLLSVLVGLMMRGSRPEKDQASDESSAAALSAEDTSASVRMMPERTSEEAHEDALVSDEPARSCLSESETREAVAAVPPVAAQSAPAPESLSESPSASIQQPSAKSHDEVDAELSEEAMDVKPEAAEEIELRFKQALHGLTADQLDLRGADSSKAQVAAASDSAPAFAPVTPIVPTVASVAAIAPVAVAPSASASDSDARAVSAAPSDSANPSLNVNHLLRQYAHNTAEKAGQTTNYYTLSERTRLQKWMSTQSLDDLLDHAQKAYAQSYPNVAHHILNEVILRGNAAQSTQALDLRNQWHIQYLRRQAQESRGH